MPKNRQTGQVRRGIALLLLCAALLYPLGISACSDRREASKPQAAAPFETFVDIPGVTSDEIAAIEALQENYESFSYGMFSSSEAFFRDDGTVGGYATLLCQWLTELFGIPFVPEHATWLELIEGLEDGSVDFTGELTPTDERRQTYFMTDAISHRWLCYFRLEDAQPLSEIAETRPLRYSVVEGTSIAEDILQYAAGPFEIVYVEDFEQIHQFLRSGAADAHIEENALEAYFDTYGDIVMESFLPLIDSPVSLTAQNPELGPIISVFQKALENGAGAYLDELYNQGYNEYRKHKLSLRLTPEELEYIASNPYIPYVAEYDNYPLSFYNTRSNEWQGAMFDVLDEVKLLTGLDFVLINDEDTNWHELLDMLERGEALFVGELLWTPEREGRFLWPDTSIFSSQPVLLSKTEFSSISINRVPAVTVGVARATANDELLHSWFPNHRYVKIYDSLDATFEALLAGEVDMIMSSTNNILYITNYLERVDVKANVLFDYAYESTFGFHKDAELLRSIFDKALHLIEIEIISNQWTQQTYDYRAQVAEARLPWLIGAIVLAAATFALVISVLYVNRRRLVDRKVLQDANKNMDMLMKAVDTMIVITTVETDEIIYVNPSMENVLKLTGTVTDAGVIGNKCWTHLNAEFGERCSHCPKNSPDIYKGEVFSWEYHNPLIDRDYRIVSRVIDWPDGRKVFLEQCDDITDLKKAAEARIALKKAEAASEAKSAFLANMSHEIRTPMNAIIGLTEIALRTDEIDTVHGYAAAVRKASKNLLSIINDILDFSKIEAGKMEIINNDYSLATLISDTVSIIRTRIADSPLRFTVKVDCNIPRTLYCDEARLRQAVLNLLGNAVKYTEKGYVSLRVKSEPAGEGRINLIFEIEDTGIGIKPEEFDKLFADFSRLDLEKNQGIEGVGLGLAITHSIVEALGGNISVKSQYGKGSLFTVTLPQTYRTDKPLVDAGRFEGKRVLIYEKDVIYLDSIVYALDNLGMRHSVVSSDASLFKEMESGQYDYLFISFNLYKDNAGALREFENKVKIAVLSEFGETVGEQGVSELAEPVYCTAIAEVLDGASENTPYEYTAGFFAPDARVLIVDDVRTNLRVAHGLIVPYQMQIDMVGSGEEALEAIRKAGSGEGRYDIIFMDQKMPGMDGVETTRRIRALGENNVDADMDSYFGSVPIIALTANIVAGAKEMFMENGFSDFLAKPINTAKLDEILRKWIPKEKQQ